MGLKTMKRSARIFAVATLITTASTPLYAEQASEFNGFKAGVGVSLTQGLGVEIGYSLTESLSLRGNYYRFDTDKNDDIDGIDFDLNIDLQNTGLYLDYHPFTSNYQGFRLTAGLINNGNSLDATGTPTNGNFDINGVTYSAAQVGTLSADVGFKSTAPYLGIGYDKNLYDNLDIVADLGVIFQGSADVTYTANGAIANDPSFQANLAAEQASAQSDLDDYKYLPVVKVGMQYRF